MLNMLTSIHVLRVDGVVVAVETHAHNITHEQLDNLGIGYVIHLAAAISVAESMKMPDKYARINVDGSRKVGVMPACAR
jgi:UDP-glucose 4-epimerase